MSSDARLLVIKDINRAWTAANKEAPGIDRTLLALLALRGRLVHVLGVHSLGLNRIASGDGNAARLERFRHFPHKVDVKHAVDVAGRGHMHVLGKGKTAFECAVGDATVKICFAIFFGGFPQQDSLALWLAGKPGFWWFSDRAIRANTVETSTLVP